MLKKINSNTLSFLLFSYFLLLTYEQCTLSSSNDLLQSGSTTFFNGRSATREHTFFINLNFNTNNPLSIAASTSTLQISIISGLDFSVRGWVGSPSVSPSITLLMDEDNTWTSIKVNYLISGRTDFTLGFYTADVFFASKYSTSIDIQFNIPNWVFSQSSYTSIAEFSGIKTAANSFSIKFSALQFNPSNGVMKLNINTGSLIPIENIYITYIIFLQSSPIIYSSFNPSNTAPGLYSFIGLEIINSAGSVFIGSSFGSAATGLTCFGSNCQASCVTSQGCTSSGGQISGNNCFICSPGQTFINGVCQAINQCGQNQYWSGTQCLCVSGYTYSASTNQCIRNNIVNCGPNFISISGNCICPTGYGIINNLCLTCPANSFVNTLGRCQCINGFTLSSTTLSCVTSCFPNSTPNSIGQCVCNDGFYNQGNSCIPVGNCQNGMIYNGQTCVCPQGTYLSIFSNRCVPCTGTGQAIQGSNCVCTSTFYPIPTGCAPCTPNSVFNNAVQQCVCLTGYTLSGGLCLNLCPPGAQWNPQTSSCRCTTPGFMLINNLCVPCPPNSYWTGTTCQCQSGLTLTNGTCISNCGINSYWNGNSCVCNTGFYLISGTCTTCKPNSSYNPADQSCLCNPGFYGNSQACYPCDSSCATCSGPANTQCLSCRTGGSLNPNGGCTNGCPTGQFLNPSNLCSNCMANCNVCTSSTSCTTCASGYTISLTISGGNVVTSCAQIPTGTSSTLTLRSYVVGNGVVYQGVALSTMPADILSAGCTVCSNLLTVNIASSFVSATSSVQYISNSQYWFLITFNFSGAPFIPSFQFTVQINPAYATSFTPIDMTQKLVSSISPQTIYTDPAPKSTFASSTRMFGSGPVAPNPTFIPSSAISASSSSKPVSKNVGNDIVAKLFGN